MKKTMFFLLFIVMAVSAAIIGKSEPVHASTEAYVGGKTVTELFNDKGNDHLGKITEQVEDVGASLYRLVLTVAFIVTVCGCAVIGVKLFGRSAVQISEAKENLVWLVVGAVIALSGIAMLTFSKDIAAEISAAFY